jgi:indole-3-glycerol phosphate synthase
MDILSQIVEKRLQRVEADRRKVDEASLRETAAARSDHRPFHLALSDTTPWVRLIAEVKRASPSKGAIDRDLDPARLARQYEEGGAACLSVLTEPDFFEGGLQDMQTARGACDLPVLRKDFLVTPYQIIESAAAGADAVLLIARILEQETLLELYELTRSLKMDALVEVYDEEDVTKIEPLPARLIGINNRNLKSFETKLDHARSVAERLGPERIPVVASGIFTRADIDYYLPEPRAFLVGESLVRAGDPIALVRHLVTGTETSASAE